MKKHIGCSGYFYWGWKGKFYPEELKPNQWFQYYSSVFDTVEINSTFYHFPKESTIKKWYKEAPENFIFSVKVNKEITHLRKFKNTKRLINKFYSVVADNLNEKLGTFLFQLPPSFHYSEQNLERIISQLNPNYKNVVEFRHISWWNDKVYKSLEEHNICFCSISSPKLPEDLVKTTDYIYVRFHGKKWYNYDYSDEELRFWADRIKNSGANECFVYFNNDYNAFAPKNALKLKELLNSL